MTLNSVELGHTDVSKDGVIRLELPVEVIRKLNHGHLILRTIVVPCPPQRDCYPRGHLIHRIRIEIP